VLDRSTPSGLLEIYQIERPPASVGLQIGICMLNQRLRGHPGAETVLIMNVATGALSKGGPVGVRLTLRRHKARIARFIEFVSQRLAAMIGGIHHERFRANGAGGAGSMRGLQLRTDEVEHSAVIQRW